jgi:hypothetical protein
VVFKRNSGEASGTALASRAALPWPVIGGGIVVIGALVLWLALRHGSSAKAESQATPDDSPQPTTVVAPAQQPGGPPPAVAPETPTPTPAPTRTGPRTDDVARELKASLDRQRLWSDVTIQGTTIEVRTSSCADPLMGPTLDSAIGSARAAGLTTLRCVSRSGGVVSQRAL